MSPSQASQRLSLLLQESKRIRLEGSFEEAESFLRKKLQDWPNDRDALSALAVLLLEAGQYARATHVTRTLTSLIANEQSQASDHQQPEGLVNQTQDKELSGDITEDLALARRFAEMDGFSPRSDSSSVQVLPQGDLQKDLRSDQTNPAIGPQAYVQKELGLDDQMPIYQRRESPHLESERIRQPRDFDSDNLEHDFPQVDSSHDRYRHGVDVTSFMDSIPDEQGHEESEEDVDEDWSGDSDPDYDGPELARAASVPVELDEEYAEDAFLESPTQEELQHIPDLKTTRDRAKEIALELVEEYDLGHEYITVLTRIFTEYWWSRCKVSMKEQLELDVSARALDMARQLRELWAEHPEYHENITEHLRLFGYESLPWRLAIRLVEAYRQYPQFEEVQGFFDYWHGEWDTRYSLQRKFPSFYSMIRHIVERSESDGVDPPAVADLFRKIEE